MKVVVSAQGDSLDAASSPVFGRCPYFVFVDTETMEAKAMPNPAMSQGGGAGIQAAQLVVNEGAKAVLTGNLGPNAYDVLSAAGVPGFLAPEGTVRQAVEAYKAGQLQPLGGANVRAHAGMGRGGRGMGMGMGRGRGMAAPAAAAPTPTPTPVAPAADESARQAELAELRQQLRDLRAQLAATMRRIEDLSKEG